MLCWLNGLGQSANNYTNKRANPTTFSSVVGRLSSIGELTNYVDSVPQSDGTWHKFRSLDNVDFWVRGDVCDYVSLEEYPFIKLDVEYHSQNDADSNISLNDCGPASSCMMLERAGISATVKEFMSMAGINHGGFTHFNDNMRGIRQYGFTPDHRRPVHLSEIIRQIQKTYPVFSLIRYHHINAGKHYGHFLVTVGYKVIGKQLWMIVHDPNRKPYMEFAAEQFGKALAYEGSTQNLPFQSMVITDYPPLEDVGGEPLPDPTPDPQPEPVEDFETLVLLKLDKIIKLLEDLQ